MAGADPEALDFRQGNSGRASVSEDSRGVAWMPSSMNELVTTPLRAGRHLAIWMIWHSTGVSLLSSDERR
jgi:hypothetical protein